MAYKASFLDNFEYGASDINDITKRLVSAGVADPLENGVSYNCSKINDVISLVATEGVVPESVNTLKCTVSGSDVIIQPGVAFFSNGSTIEITSAESLPITEGVVNYVYLKSDLTLNKIYPECSAIYPTEDFVMLAEIQADKTVKDKRKYAKGKLPGYQSYANMTLTVTDNVMLSKNDGQLSYSAESTSYVESYNYSGSMTVDVGINNYRYVVCENIAGVQDGIFSKWDIATGDRFGMFVQGSNARLIPHWLYVYRNTNSQVLMIDNISIAGGVATISFKYRNNTSTPTIYTPSFTLKFIAQEGDI